MPTRTKRLCIGLDFDDVLVAFNEALLTFHNEHYGTSYGLNDVTTWDLHELWKCSPEEAYARMKEFVRSSHHEAISPVSGAVEAIKFLNNHHDLHIITARDETLYEETLRLLSRHFNSVTFKGLHFLHRNNKNVRGTKGDVCRSLGVHVLIEDSLHNAYTAHSHSVHVLLFDTPWNQTTNLPTGIKRVFSWKEVLGEIVSHS